MSRTLQLGIALWMGLAVLAAQAADPPGVGAWHALLADRSAPAWRGWKQDGLPTGWHVAKGVLFKQGNVDDLVTLQTYGNFELELDWKIGKAGNSGIFYRGTREYDEIYWSGPEYQLLDDADTEDGRNQLTAAGSAYAVYPSVAGVVHPFGQWNHARLLVQGNHVEHWLNGRRVVEYELLGSDWQQRVAASKFSKYPHYGQAKLGLIGIQGDHPGDIALRRIRIRDLP